MPDTLSSDVLERLPCDHCGKPRGQHSGAIPNCMMYPTYKNTLHATIERLSAELARRTELLGMWRKVVNEGGVPRYTITPGAALNTLVTWTDAALSDTKAG